MNNDFTGPKLPETIRIDDKTIINSNNVRWIETLQKEVDGIGRTYLRIHVSCNNNFDYLISTNDNASEINIRAKLFADYLGLQYKEWV